MIIKKRYYILNSNLILKTILFPVMLIGLNSCANIVTPPGGPIDKDPPEVLEESPPNNSTNINPKEIRIRFDEFVELNNPQQQIIISPLLKNNPEYRIRGRNLVILIDDTLREETTYVINFGAAIRDITEGNVLENYKFVFSTGDFIDSLSISGSVKNAFNYNPEKQITVSLYESFEDSAVYKKKPLYISRTDDNGRFELSNIKEGEYYIFALEDKNFNLIYDLSDERIAFKEEPLAIYPDTSLADVDLLLFQEFSRRPGIKEQKRLSKHIQKIIYSRPIDTISLQTKEAQEDRVDYLNHYLNLDTLFITQSIVKDSLNLVVEVNNVRSDTLLLSPFEEAQFELLEQPNFSKISPGNVSLKFLFSDEIEMFNAEAIKLFTKDSIPVQIDVLSNDIITNRPWSFILTADLKEGTEYKLVFLDSAFLSKSNLYYPLTTDTFNIAVAKENALGAFSINLSITDDEHQYIMQFFTSSRGEENIHFQKIINPPFIESIRLRNIPPASYQLRFIQDLSRSGYWNPGNFNIKRQPEPILYYPGTIDVRANWESEITINDFDF
ncbi:MAG: hypothetical protein EA412_09970 [Chitinophagaceae bacterium]|nr:MAG: hypothetical protein EA412_09970 [Chitinophagaceae bacterium]